MSMARTRSQVLAAREQAVMGGCCERFADQQACDCLETALPDPPNGGETVRLETLCEGDMFQLEDGRVGQLVSWSGAWPKAVVRLVKGDNQPVPGTVDVKLLSLEEIQFLLMAAADRLQEHEAYNRGHREGAEQMRRRIARQVGGATANYIRNIPLGPVAGGGNHE